MRRARLLTMQSCPAFRNRLRNPAERVMATTGRQARRDDERAAD